MAEGVSLICGVPLVALMLVMFTFPSSVMLQFSVVETLSVAVKLKVGVVSVVL